MENRQADDSSDVLHGVEIIINTIKEERDPEALVWKICGKVLDIFGCDRAWLLFPCDPDSPSWSVPVERTVPEYPGANVEGLTIDMTPDVAEIFQAALDSEVPLIYGPGGLPLAENTKSFQVKSQLSMAIYPRIGRPWQFGIHQCAFERVWTKREMRLFQAIGVMTAEALGNILLFRDQAAANENLEKRVNERTAELIAEKDFAEGLIETARAIVLVLDTEGRIVRFNPYMEQLSGYRLEEVAGLDWFDTFLLKEEADWVHEIFDKAVTDVATKGVVNRILTRDGRERVIQWHDTTLKDAEKRIVGVLAIGHDITERVDIEERIRASLEEKKILLQEIHHRVKNNMQIISSLVGIQRVRMKDNLDPETLAAFVEIGNRINSMALVHERLYRSADFVRVDFATYAEQLAKELLHAYGKQPDAVVLETRLDDVRINMNQAIPCGLILNELLSNALKYAFPDNRTGRILVALDSDSCSSCCLSVCDDGIGLPAGLDVKTAQTTGMVIVNALVRQLQAELQIEQGYGVCFNIRFKGI